MQTEQLVLPCPHCKQAWSTSTFPSIPWCALPATTTLQCEQCKQFFRLLARKVDDRLVVSLSAHEQTGKGYIYEN